MMPVLQIGPLSIQTPGLLIVIGLMIGLSASEKFAPRFQVDPNRFYALAITALAAFVASGRLAYVARFPSAFEGNWLAVFSPNPSLFSLSAGIAGGILAGAIYGQRREMRLWAVLDTATPALGVLMIALGTAHLASGQGYGAETTLLWGIDLWGAKRHPTQIMEIILGCAALWITWPGRRAYDNPHPPGWFFLTFTAITAGGMLVIEALRAESFTTVGNIRLLQIGAWLVLAAALFLRGKLANQALPVETG